MQRLKYCDLLDHGERERLRELATLFLLEKNFEGAAGLSVSDEMRLWVALQACVLILNLGIDYYAGWSAVILYPGDFRVRRQYMEELSGDGWNTAGMGVLHDEDDILSGESWPQGPVILSWEAVSNMHARENIVMHEFAHKIDMLNGEADGFPPLHTGMRHEDWSRDFETAYTDLCAAVDDGLPVRIDAYAAESPAEFFAVMSETLFVDPETLAGDYPVIYRHLSDFYRQDPLRRMTRPV